MDRALLVGINSYRQCPLAGCVNDVSMMANTLVERYGFEDKSIRMVTDDRATTRSILENLEWLIEPLQSGDRCLFHFSGHGVQVATKNYQREIDGLDEVICPVDFDWTEGHLIRDKQLYQIFRRIPNGVKFNWVNDSCHSGDLTKAMTRVQQAPRTIPPPADVAWDIRVAKQKKLCCVGMNPCNHVVDIHGRSITNGVLNVGFVSGCASNQTSADTEINAIKCGALTWHFVKAVKEMPKKTPLYKIVEAIRAELAKKGYSQRPQAEGSRKGMPFLA